MPLIRRSRAALRALLPLLALVMVAGCGDGDPIGVDRAPVLTLAPTSVALAVGDSAVVGVTATGGEPGVPTYRWTSGQPTLVQVDSATTTAAQARVRGVAPGTAAVMVAVSKGGVTVTIALPVTVTARQAAPVPVGR